MNNGLVYSRRFMEMINMIIHKPILIIKMIKEK